MADKQKATQIITPAFIATMCYLTTPSQFGKYTVRGTFDPQIPEHRKFLGQLKKLHKEAVADAQSKFKPSKKQKELEVSPCMTENEDAPTFYVQMSETAEIEWKDKKSGEKKKANLKPVQADANGAPCNVDIWQGSKLKAAIDVVPYFTGGSKVGLSLRLKGVQVLELVTRGAQAPLFGKAEGSFDSNNFMPPAAETGAGEDDEFDDFGAEDDDATETTEEGGELAPSGDDDDFDF